MKLSGHANGRREPIYAVMCALSTRAGLAPLAWLELDLRTFLRIVRVRNAA